MRTPWVLLVLIAPLAQAQIYKCEGAEGPVYSDRPCSDQAEIVTVRDSSSGIAPGPSDEAKQYLADKRDQRASDRAQRASAPASNQPQAPVVVSDGQDYGYPVYWPAYGNRPNRPPRPKPEPPIVQPDPGGSVIRPRGGRR